MKYSELDESAKIRALESYSNGAMDYEWWDSIYESAKTAGRILGIDIDRIYFSGFSSQGDGACFEGSYCYAKGSARAIREEFPTDKELHRIGQELQKIQARHFYRLSASCRQRGHYNHSGCMSVSVEDQENQYRDIGAAEEDITQALRDFADWIYSALETEYEYLTSREAMEEMIEANEYEFDEDGNMI